MSNDKIKPPSKFTGNFARKANRRNRTKDFSCYVCAKRLPIEARITTLYCSDCLKKRRTLKRKFCRTYQFGILIPNFFARSTEVSVDADQPLV